MHSPQQPCSQPYLQHDSPHAALLRFCAVNCCSSGSAVSNHAAIHTSGGRYPRRATPYTIMHKWAGSARKNLAWAHLQKLSSQASPGCTPAVANPQINLKGASMTCNSQSECKLASKHLQMQCHLTAWRSPAMLSFKAATECHMHAPRTVSRGYDTCPHTC